MADLGLFVGWGQPFPGKEKAAAKVFEEAMAQMAALKAAGEIESFETVLLSYHGGDLNGFFLVRGDPEKLARLSMSPDFQRLNMRAAVCLGQVGVVPAFIDSAVSAQMARWQEVIADLV